MSGNRSSLSSDMVDEPRSDNYIYVRPPSLLSEQNFDFFSQLDWMYNRWQDCVDLPYIDSSVVKNLVELFYEKTILRGLLPLISLFAERAIGEEDSF